MRSPTLCFFFFFFNDTATTEIYTLSLHDALPISYGVSKDPAYPLFYYNLACVAADKSDVAEAERNLKLAYQYRKNMIPGEPFPDARGDDSFQVLLRNKEFRAFVEALYAPSP